MNLSIKYVCFFLMIFSLQTGLLIPFPARSQLVARETATDLLTEPWECSTYPDESGFQQRISGMLEKIAARDFGKRSLAFSKCPDTGLPVYTWALEGEEIISPYSGRKYRQGDTGYFGPKKRNSEGQIVAFGGDPLKYDLPPATACLILGQRVEEAKAFLSIPGNLNQQYHFACKNWARFYPLLADKMGDSWKKGFFQAVAHYAESRRPSDGEREWLNLASPHNLVGQKDYLLGGNPVDGGTENHKTMWRTSCLLYSQLFPDTARISGYPVKEAEKLSKEMLRDYLKRLLITGNGEYDSQVYYPHSIESFLNLYDFSPDEETRLLAKFAIDYYFVTYGLKVIDGTIAGAQKRGYLAEKIPNEMENMLWAFFNHTSRPMDNAAVTIQQATTTYRPNRIICNIVNKNLKTPFNARMSRPFYHMDKAGAFAETFYCSDSYALGNVQMTIVDNPNQQMVWSLVTRGKDKPLCFSGGQPLRGSTSGHSPYTQTLQDKGTLIVMTAPTTILSEVDTLAPPTPEGYTRANYWHLSVNDQYKSFELSNRKKYGSDPLHEVRLPADSSPEEIDRFWNESKNSASTWFYFPRELQPAKLGNRFYFNAGSMLLAVIPLTENAQIVRIDQPLSLKNKEAQKFFREYSILAFTGEVSGYIIETVEKSKFPDIADFDSYLTRKTKFVFHPEKLRVDYTSGFNDKIRFQYNPVGLRCNAFINGKRQDFDQFTEGAVYYSPYLNIRDGFMEVSDGKERYRVDFRGEMPVYTVY